MSRPNAYHPEDITRIREEGAILVRWVPSGVVLRSRTPNIGWRAALFDKQGVLLLQDNLIWIRKQASMRKWSYTTRMWQPANGGHGSITTTELFLTPWGARTVASALEMEALSNNSKEPSPSQSIVDTYSNAEDTFIERHGFSSSLD